MGRGSGALHARTHTSARAAARTLTVTVTLTLVPTQELSLLTQMGWAKCMGSSCSACASAEQSVDDSPSSPVEPSAQLQMEVADLGAEEAEQARLKLQLSVEEWSDWEQQKDDLLEERQRMREQLKQRFEEFCERSGVGIFGRP